MSALNDWYRHLRNCADAHARTCAAFMLANERSPDAGFLAEAQRQAARFELFWEWEGLALQKTREVVDASGEVRS